MESLQGVSLKCQNFKCFAEEPQGFAEIKPINVIIGRNNSGKSTLLDLIHYATEMTDITHLGHKRTVPKVFLSCELTKIFIKEKVTEANMSTESGTFIPRNFATQKLMNKELIWELSGKHRLIAERVTGYKPGNHFDKLAFEAFKNQMTKEGIKNPFSAFEFRRIHADRDVVPQGSNDQLEVKSNGEGVSNVIQRFLHADWLERDLVEKKLLEALNTIFVPDAAYSRILAEQQENGLWEIHLVEPRKGQVRMSQTGSGLKTVLIVLANLLLVPNLEEKPIPLSDFLFGFEELENNLHPAIQRRLFRYIRKFAIKNKCHFFITTHSNVVIDMFSNDKHAQILHVTHDGESATVNRVDTYQSGSAVLDDLGVRASDLLQTNVVVWVEGPSDRYYFNRWIELWTEGELVEGIHYQCLHFGGSLNAHLSFNDPEEIEVMIKALKINRNAILLADSDKHKENDDLKVHSKRLKNEVEESGCLTWITKGKEIENYIPQSLFGELLNNEALKGPGLFSDVFAYIAGHKENKAKPTKVALARKIVPMLNQDLIRETHDMAEHLDEICKRIYKWNNIEQTENV